MPTAVRSYAKINIGLAIGAVRDDGFHELRTIYQTVGLHDVVKVEVARGTGIEIRCKNPRVPTEETNTCYRVADRFMKASGLRGKVIITIEKNLPLEGGLGAASSNAVATLFALEREAERALDPEDRLRICEEVGSDLPLFLIGGTIYGAGRGERVLPLEDLPSVDCVIVTPGIGISTPRAFADWDALAEREAESSVSRSSSARAATLTEAPQSAKILSFSRVVYAWLSSGYKTPVSGVPARGGTGPRHSFSTLSVPGSKTTSNALSFLSIPNCVTSSVCFMARAAMELVTPRFPALARQFMASSIPGRRPKLLQNGCRIWAMPPM